SAIVPGCDLVDGASGSAAIRDVNLWLVAALGIRANSVASRHGSTPIRANAERTLSTMPFFSSPIGANRKALNSDPSWTGTTERLISTTGVSSSCRAWRPIMPHVELLLHPEEPYGSEACGVRIGNYSMACPSGLPLAVDERVE